MLSKPQIATIKKALKKFPEVQIAWIFGSAAAGRLKASSDLDIGIATGKKLSLKKKVDIQLALSRATKREIDLVHVDSVSGVILQQILCKGERIFTHNKLLLAALIRKLWYDQADWMPLYRRILDKRREMFLNDK
jgi:uncharacterized protein